MTATASRPTLAAAGAEAVLDPSSGGRIAALRVDGLDLLLTEGFGPLAWGCYPMVPWAGRLADGRISSQGETHALPLTMPPHAIHGTTWDVRWDVRSLGPRAAEMSVELRPPWLFGGRAVSRAPPALRRRWWRAVCSRADRTGSRPQRSCQPPPVRGTTRSSRWPGRPSCAAPGALEVEVCSDAAWWTIYTKREEGICVEPQTGPPNGLATGEHAVVLPGSPLTATMSLAWRRLG